MRMLHVNHFWELNAANILLRFLIKVTCMSILLFFTILLFQLTLHSNFSTKFYFLSIYLELLVLDITEPFCTGNCKKLCSCMALTFFS